jgi:hypothetical protein
MKVLVILFFALAAVTLSQQFTKKIDPQVFVQLNQKTSGQPKADINVLMFEKVNLSGFENIRDHDERGIKVLKAVNLKLQTKTFSAPRNCNKISSFRHSTFRVQRNQIYLFLHYQHDQY